MPQAPDNITILLIRHLRGELSLAEAQELEAWQQLLPGNREIAAAFMEEELLKQQLLDVLSKQAVWSRLSATIQTTRVSPPARVFLFRRWVAAAAVVLLLAAGTWFWLRPHGTVPTFAKHQTEVAPGKSGAILTLADGRQVVLDSLQNGVVARQDGAQVVLKNGQLVYDSAAATDGKMAYNTMSTPRGRQFRLVLPDGTQVWLNAASSIRYPVAFTGKERRVDITGEAYLEVAKNAAMPFFVNANNKAAIEVLGTHFNVNAYNDEKELNTTLLEGSLRVSNPASKNPTSAILLPNQQASMDPAANVIVVRKAEVNRVMAWKNGFFSFDNTGIEEVMRQLVRWYDIEVVYESGIPNIRFGGEMSKDLLLSDLLRTLEESKVHVRFEAGRRLVVLP